MALAMTPATVMPSQHDTMDIDIDMEIDDIGPVADEDILEEGEEPELIPNSGQVASEQVPAIYLEDPAQEPVWEKVHVRGVDDLSTDNIRRFANDYYPDAEPHVQWIDDTSANLVYKDKSQARGAIRSLVMHEITEAEIFDKPFELRTAKPLVTNPGSILTVRIAMVGDRKKRNAREASRYYLMHPEADPEERARRSGRGEYGDYKRRKFDDKEHKRRQRHQDDNMDSTNDFEASMYDDAPAEKAEPNSRGRDLFSRINKPRHRSASPVANADAISMTDSDSDSATHRRRRNGYRNREITPPRRRNAGRELFGGSGSDSNGMRSENADLFSRISKPILQKDRSNTTSYEANQGVARQLRADLKAAQNQSPARSHRRSRAIDTRVEEDLSERFGRKSLSLDSTKSVRETTSNSGKELFGDRNANSGGFSIKGTANQGMSIKGRGDVKELFPERFSTGGRGANAGKELFDQPVRNRASRQKAGDLFD